MKIKNKKFNIYFFKKYFQENIKKNKKFGTSKPAEHSKTATPKPKNSE
jgi:hypothetical protein